ncbi:hypothetical protein NH286_03120 [Anaerococcus sp. NML200574]|uniref:hypothetical protein n=1 Tax=Anaerococcus sp. NML200574 TaxID=2954486 RepID=UPI0022381121|nr:hypothetical protein [Anaerococcus sp. NML200574]MCW6678144.1 hypothetical protein [Anaerococcus sp. NML200574]
MTLYEKIIELAANQGIAIAVSVVVILLILVFGRSSLKQFEEQKKLDRENFKAEKEIERQERKEDRQAQREQTKSLIDLHSQTNEAILKFTEALKNSDSLLDKHNICAEENFGELKSDVKDIIGRLDIVQDTTKELATKEMLEEVKQEILRIKRD